MKANIWYMGSKELLKNESNSLRDFAMDIRKTNRTEVFVNKDLSESEKKKLLDSFFWFI